MRNNGFLQPGHTTTLSADYVKEQRKEVVEAYQKKLEKLKAEYDDLMAKKATIEVDLKVAFEARFKKVEQEEKRLKDVDHVVSGNVMKLESLKSEHREAVKALEKANMEALEVLKEETKKSKSILESAAKREESTDKAIARFDEYSKTVTEKEEWLNKRSEALDKREKDLNNRQGEISAEVGRYQEVRDKIRTEQDMLALNRDANRKQLEQISSERSELMQIRQQVKDETTQLRIDREENQRLARTNADTAKSNRILQRKNEEKEDQLKIWESEYNVRKANLDLRQRNIEAWEKATADKVK
jgi:chromosome segregation ATPase